MTPKPIQLGILGGGVMAEAILSGLLHQGIYAAEAVKVSDPQDQRRQWLQQQYGVATTPDNCEVISGKIILLAIKPQIFTSVVSDLAACHQNLASEGPTPLILSILAGLPLSKLEGAFPHQAVIRAMPNAPAMAGEGMTAISPGQWVQPEQLQQAQEIFGAIGQVVQVPESLMDAVTGLSGSGPAYVALMVEALADGGVAAGLPRAVAQQLALQTVRGTTGLLAQDNLHPALLKDRVTSPGGTTIAGIATLEKAGFRSAVIEAVKAATARSQELGN